MTRVPVDTDIKIFLAKEYNEIAWQEYGSPVLVAVSDDSHWNDFSRNFRAELHFQGFQEQHTPIPIRLMFEDIPKTTTAVLDILGTRSSIDVVLVKESFISVLENTTAYRTIVQRLGFEEAFAALRRLHDAVVTRIEDVDKPTLELSKSLAFTESVLRDNATWDAYSQGGRYLTPHRVPDIDDAAHSFKIEIQLEGMRGLHALEADFEDDFPLSRRMLVLVGENGSGKTRLLNSLIQGLQTMPKWGESPCLDQNMFDPYPQFSRLLVFSSVSSDPYPRQLPPWRGLDYRFHRLTAPERETSDDLAQSLLNCMRSVYEIEGLDGTQGSTLLDEVLEELGIGPHLYVEVDTVGPDTEHLSAPINIDGSLYLPFFSLRGEQRRLQLQAKMKSGAPPKVITDEHRVRSLSSGELVLLRFVTQAIGSVRQGSIFIFDEPETHLHPRFVSIFASTLDRLLEWSGSIAIIATHSAYIVREVPARRVRIIDKNKEGEVLIEPPTMQTFGASIDTISQFIFGDIALKHRFQQLLDKWLDETSNATPTMFRDRFRKDMNAETLSYLSQINAEGHSR